MSWSLLKETHPVARKEYHCEASDWIGNNCDLNELTLNELAVFEKAKSERFKIMPGTKYVKITGIYNGEFSTFRARADLNKICLDRDLYPGD